MTYPTSLNARSLHPVLLPLLLAALLVACRQPESEWIPEEEMVREGVLACEEMLHQLERVDPETASDEELEAAIAAAERNEARCRNQLSGAGSTPGERAFYVHRADEIRFFVYLFEAALSRRFDGYEGYCVILHDIMTLLAEGIETMNATLLEEEMDDLSRRRLRELMILDLQTLELMSVESNETCE